MTALKLGKSTAAMGAAILIVFGTTGCATKKHVRQVVAPVEARVSVNEKKTSDHASAIGELENGVSRADERAMDAERKATAAGQNADKANQAAAEAATRADNARGLAENARGLAESTRSRLGEVVENMDNYKLVTTESVLFTVGKSTLSKAAKETLDQAVGNIVNNKNYVLEIQGYTDKTGGKAANLILSQKRADEVVRYLTVQHQVPLRKIHVLGIGADDPNADNKTRAARKQNRRVDVKVFALDLGAGKDGTQAATPQRSTEPAATTPPRTNP
ncbi:MAG TPA: OmpA family protein [Bryobacteraceae bacterium]|nr:OmpA family protein [Bryobacteraceae bacterium]